jgi:hypothetical protein
MIWAEHVGGHFGIVWGSKTGDKIFFKPCDLWQQPTTNLNTTSTKNTLEQPRGGTGEEE